MGSAGSGKFGTYRIDSFVEGNIGGEGFGNGESECPILIENVRLEDVSTSEYYLNNNSLPIAQSNIQIRKQVYLGRLVVETIDTNEVIGNLPTQYNYLLNCIKKGFDYIGTVVSSGNSPIPYVVVTLNA